jgi:hypothetical protein
MFHPVQYYFIPCNVIASPERPLQGYLVRIVSEGKSTPAVILQGWSGDACCFGVTLLIVAFTRRESRVNCSEPPDLEIELREVLSKDKTAAHPCNIIAPPETILHPLQYYCSGIISISPVCPDPHETYLLTSSGIYLNKAVLSGELSYGF